MRTQFLHEFSPPVQANLPCLHSWWEQSVCEDGEAKTGPKSGLRERESLDSVQNLDVKELAGESIPGRKSIHIEL